MNKRIGRWKNYKHLNAKTIKWKIEFIDSSKFSW